MDDYLDKLISFLVSVNYTISSGLFIGSAMNYLNENAAAFGVIIGFLTFFAQIYFNTRQQLMLTKKLDKED
jgi:hypothetical protein